MFAGLWKLLRKLAVLMGVHPPPGPYAGFWSWRYLNLVKTARMVMSKRVKGFYREFPNRFPLGSEFPAIQLETTDGRRVDTGDLLGRRHLVLFTGAIT